MLILSSTLRDVLVSQPSLINPLLQDDAYVPIRSNILRYTERHPRDNFVKIIREVFVRMTVPLVSLHIEESHSTSVSFTSAAVEQTEMDVLFDTCLRSVTALHSTPRLITDSPSTAPPSPFQKSVEEFSREILSCPLLSTLLTSRSWKILAEWPHLPTALRHLLAPALALPPSPHPVFQSGQWVLGNICALGPYLNIVTSPLRTDRWDMSPTGGLVDSLDFDNVVVVVKMTGEPH